MSHTETAALLQDLYWISLIAVIVSSASGVLKAGANQFDLFGMIMIGVATGLGGGSVRDWLLGLPVFWIEDDTFFVVSMLSAILVFAMARLIVVPQKLFLVADAAGLATFGIAGTLVAHIAGAPPLIASFMGVLTGIMGGIVRDMMCNAPPVVFSGTLYGIVSWVGSLLFIGLLHWPINTTLSAVIAGLFIFFFRLLALRYNLNLPTFRFKSK